MQEFLEDLEKYHFYLSAKFEFYESILFSNLVKKPSPQEFNQIKFKLKKQEIERLYNHFHISTISANINKQREYSTKIWKKWRLFFDKEMPGKEIMIEIFDSGKEIIIYVYENN